MTPLNILNKKPYISVIAGLAVIAMLFLPLDAGNLWMREFFNTGHTVLFFFLAIILYFWLESNYHFSSVIKVYFLTVLVGLLLGAFIELLQGMLQRESSLDDLIRDVFGLLSGLSFILFMHQKYLLNKVLAIIFVLVFSIAGSISLIQISWHYLQREKAFPMLTQLQEGWTSSFVHFDRVRLLKSVAVRSKNSKGMFHLRFDPGMYPGLSIVEPEEDWSAYDQLRFNVYSDNSEDIVLTLRVHDKDHNQKYSDRFNQSFIIRHGLNKMTVSLSRIRNAPVNRKLDLAHVAGLKLFLVDVKKPVFLDVSDIFLLM